MRTLSRPMFNMGGPIKQGIMNGIREPYKHGGPTGTGLVGDQRYPQTGGREHHVAFIPPLLAGLGMAGRFLARPFGKYVMSKIPISQAIKFAGKKGARKVIPGKMSKKMMDVEKFQPYKFWANDPLYKAATASSGVAGKVIRGGGKLIKGAATTPTGLLSTAATTAYFWPDGTPKSTTDLIEDNVIRKGDKDYGPHTKGAPTITASAREAKAKADKEKRINDLLDTMGYDKARKNAAYDALIDAGRMVSERGSLKAKDIGRELIDPIVAATSQRFDKPEQIREAVGLMQVKADIQKDMTKDETALANQVKRMNLEIGKKTLAGDSFRDILAKRSLKADAPVGGELAHILRTTEGIDAVVLPIKIPAGQDALEVATETIKETWTNPELIDKKVDPGYYVVSNRVIIVDEQGNVTPYIPN